MSGRLRSRRDSVLAPRGRARVPAATPALALAAAPLIYAVGFQYFRDLGEWPLVLTMACSLASVIVSNKLIMSHANTLFACTSVVFLLLSLSGVVPNAWTVYRDDFAAIRQWIWIPMIPLLVTNFHLIVTTTVNYFGNNIVLYSAVIFVCSRLALLADSGWNLNSWSWQSNGMTNEIAILMCLLSCLIVKEKSPYVVVAVILLSCVFLTSVQVYMLLAAILGVRVMRSPGPVLYVSFFLVILGHFVGPIYVEELYALDGNTGVRAVLWRDVWQAVVESWGVGVGFGTEYIKNDFSAIKPGQWGLSDEEGRLFVATHSTFYDVLLRMGVPGLSLFIWWLVRAMKTGPSDGSRVNRFGATLVVIFLFMNAFNSGLTSMNFIFGSCFVLACLHSVRELRRHESEEATARTSRSEVRSSLSWRAGSKSK